MHGPSINGTHAESNRLPSAPELRVTVDLGDEVKAMLKALAEALVAFNKRVTPLKLDEICPPELDVSTPGHSPDFASVAWNGKRYTLTPKQRIVIRELWKGRENGTPYLGGAHLLEKAGSEQGRMSHLFRDSPAWRSLIVPGELHGGPADTYCLAPPANT